MLRGEYGQDDLFISVPAIIDCSGVREIVELRMTPQEQEEFNQSCQRLKSFYDLLNQ